MGKELMREDLSIDSIRTNLGGRRDYAAVRQIRITALR
jgi:hypothetical protein